MDNRSLLPEGYRLKSGSREYIIEKYISAGSNSIVYQAAYEDTLMPEHVHTVLIKELYPADAQGRITRDEEERLTVPPETVRMFKYQKASFLLGNQAHLTLSAKGSERIAENLDSFEANGTLYTVLTAKKGQVLSEMLESGRHFPTLTDAVSCIRNLLYALQSFHSHNLLHLDISPDNIFILAPETEKVFPTEVLLLDFNSVYSMDMKADSESQYYLGKEDYMAPEVFLHREKELGYWTDLYSVSAVFYEMLTGTPLPKDRELQKEREFVSPYCGLLLHEKERSAQLVNHILEKGLQIEPGNRYQSIEEMQDDFQKLQDVLNGVIQISIIPRAEDEKEKSYAGKLLSRKYVRITASILVLSLVAVSFYKAGSARYRQPVKETKLDLAKYPLETDDSVVLTQRNVRNPLKNNILTMQVNAQTCVEINMKDYEHERNLSDVFQGFAFFPFYNGKGDKRGWQFADLTYDFFYTEDNTLHTVLPIQDENDFDLEYVGVAFQNSSKDNTSAILDINKFTLTDKDGKSYEMTEMLGSHLLFFDEENWQMNLMTTQSQDYVKSFKEIYGGELVVDASVCFLDPVLEVKFESEDPKIASVDERGRIFGNRQGTTTLTISVKDKVSGETKKTQMLVHVTSALE